MVGRIRMCRVLSPDRAQRSGGGGAGCFDWIQIRGRLLGQARFSSLHRLTGPVYAMRLPRVNRFIDSPITFSAVVTNTTVRFLIPAPVLTRILEFNFKLVISQ